MNTLHEYLFTFMYLVGTLDRLCFFRCKAKKKRIYCLYILPSLGWVEEIYLALY
jgi:hypothetical protein